MKVKPKMEAKKVETPEDLKNLIRELFKGKKVEVYLFGSRAKGIHSEFSDFDLAFLSEEDISKELTLLKEILEESNFPYKVDLVDLKRSPYLKEVVLKEGKRWL